MHWFMNHILTIVTFLPLAGAVLNGPATQALRQFPTQFTNNVLTFST